MFVRSCCDIFICCFVGILFIRSEDKYRKDCCRMESNEGGEGVQTTSTSKIPRKEAFQSLLTDKARKSTSNIRVDNKSSIDKSTNKTKDKNGMLGRNTGKVLKSIRLSNKHIDSSISTIPRSLPKSVINTIDV